jgi:cation diffusion facilitator family transporter
LEGVISIITGALAGSVALVGFGIDSAIESLSGGIMIWRFRNSEKRSEEENERIEKLSQKLVAITFFILAAYVLYESVEKLVSSDIPDPSLLGIGIAVASFVFMPILYYFKIKTAKALGSKSLEADAKETLACWFLSIALLIGLVLNYVSGLWQADPIVGIVIVIYLVKEGYENLTEEEEE